MPPMESTEFKYPRSLVGRALFYGLAAVPAIQIAFVAVLMFLHTAARAAYRLYQYGAAERGKPRGELFTSFDDRVLHEISGLFFTILSDVLIFVNVYFDAVFSVCAFGILCWLAARFRKNGAFGARDWFRVCVWSAGLFSFFSVATGWLSVAFGYSEFSLHLDAVVPAERLAKFALFFLAARHVFLKVPFAEDSSWKNELSAREFFVGSLKFFASLPRKIGRVNTFYIAAALLALEWVKIYLQRI